MSLWLHCCCVQPGRLRVRGAAPACPAAATAAWSPSRPGPTARAGRPPHPPPLALSRVLDQVYLHNTAQTSHKWGEMEIMDPKHKVSLSKKSEVISLDSYTSRCTGLLLVHQYSNRIPGKSGFVVRLYPNYNRIVDLSFKQTVSSVQEISYFPRAKE